MAENTGEQTAEQTHCEAFGRENADPDSRRSAHKLTTPPLEALADRSARDELSDRSALDVTARRALATIITDRTSFDVWAALANLEALLSDYRRIAPRFHFMQTAGEASVAVGNEYRLTVSDPDRIVGINDATTSLMSGDAAAAGIADRIMDVRVVRSGPWGGETGELVVEALRNHALAGASSLWVLAHDQADDGNMRLTLDALEIARWAWAPDYLAHRHASDNISGSRIMDWDYLFERIAMALDGTPVSAETDSPFSISASAHDLTNDDRVLEALKTHRGLRPYMEQLTSP